MIYGSQEGMFWSENGQNWFWVETGVCCANLGFIWKWELFDKYKNTKPIQPYLIIVTNATNDVGVKFFKWGDFFHTERNRNLCVILFHILCVILHTMCNLTHSGLSWGALGVVWGWSCLGVVEEVPQCFVWWGNYIWETQHLVGSPNRLYVVRFENLANQNPALECSSLSLTPNWSQDLHQSGESLAAPLTKRWELAS